MNESGLKRIRVLLFAASSLALIPFLANCFGYSIYVYLNSETESRILGISEGSCRLARQPMANNFSEESMESLQEAYSYFPEIKLCQWIDTERTEIFIESGHGLPMRSLSFSSANELDCASIEFPWLLIPLGIFVVALTIPKRIAERQSVDDFS